MNHETLLTIMGQLAALETYGVGTCDDCKRDGRTHDQPLVEYGSLHVCRDCARRRVSSATNPDGTPQAQPRMRGQVAQPSPERCTDCRHAERNGAHYADAYLCVDCELVLLRRLGLAPAIVDHDQVAA